MPERKDSRQTIKNRQTKAMNKAYNDLIKTIALLFFEAQLNDQESFRFEKLRGDKRARATRAFRQYRKETLSIIAASQVQAWEAAQRDALRYINNNINRLKPRLTELQFKAKLSKLSKIPDTSGDLKEFQNRKFKVGSLSDRVWDIQNLAKHNIEIALTDALNKGKSAQQLARSIRVNLRNPNALFRRVRDAKGRLVQSKAMRAYKPGQGVYKSAHQNALRLARNEINLAYGRAQQLYIEQSPDIVGQEIHLSNRHEVPDICDELKGKYPPHFKWAQWHIQDLCYRTFILKTDKEFIYELRTGEKIKREDSENYVKEVPDHFRNWLKENRESLEGRKHKPTFLEENGF